MKVLKYRDKSGKLIPINFYEINKIGNVTISQELGSSETEVISQKVVTDELKKKVNTQYLEDNYYNNSEIDELFDWGEYN